MENPETHKPYTTFKTFWKVLVKRANLPGFRIHDLRHTFASLAKQRGVDETVIMDIMGHKTRSMVKRYSHTSVETLHQAAKKLSAKHTPSTQPSELVN